MSVLAMLGTLAFKFLLSFLAAFVVFFLGFSVFTWAHKRLGYRHVSVLAGAWFFIDLLVWAVAAPPGWFPLAMVPLRTAALLAAFRLNETLQNPWKPAAFASAAASVLIAGQVGFSTFGSLRKAGQVASGMQEARAAFEAGRFEEAFQLVQLPAQHGKKEARTLLGRMYYRGQGVRQDHAAALASFREAAEGGDVEAQFFVGLMAAQGEGMARDHKEAAAWFLKAAEQGHDAAQANLGWMYQSGLGVPKDRIEAYKWYLLAAERGNSGAASSRDRLAAQLEDVEREAAERRARAAAAKMPS